ncbi:11465_t:CDS:1 [Paraglomus brasilianum]|uniref:11465_t:CDS:1 n=1 Tax=Paraglomus brasilianum TaxID=144538 RepID=A0A9N9CXL2_9GLOM|nr:11465_t:CDS:1 [Paraglomus brasilianum]
MVIKVDIYKKANETKSPRREVTVVRKRLRSLTRKKLKCELLIAQRRRRSTMVHGMRRYRKKRLKKFPPMLTIYEETVAAFDKEPDSEEDELCRRMARLCKGDSYEMTY